MLVEVIGVLLIFYSIWFYLENYRDKSGRPPGPTRFPPFGSMFQVLQADKVTHIALAMLAKKYGDVMSIKMGLMDADIFTNSVQQISIFLQLKISVQNSFQQAIKQVFVKDEASGRDLSGFFYDRNLKQNIGLVMANGPEWIESRNFCRNSLKHYGYGNRDAMKNLLLDELIVSFGCLEQEFKSNPEGRVHIESNYFHRTFANIMSTLIIGQRFNYDDPDFQYLLQIEHEIAKNGTMGAGLMMAFPFLRYIFPDTLGFTAQMKGTMAYCETSKKILRQRRELGHYRKHPMCFTDDFLRKMDDEANNSKSLYTEDHYSVTYMDFLQPGSDTTSNVINFILLHVMCNSEIQDKVYEEISNVIGTDRTPDIQDKLLMPYTQAVILEGLRWSRVVVMGVPRSVLANFTYQKYRIKKGTTLIFNLHSIFFDEDVWGDLKIFRPERYFNKAGKIDSKMMDIINISFGTGPRICFDEVLARDSMFIFVTSMIQKFRFTLPPGSNPSLEPLVGITLFTQPYDAIVQLRNDI